MFTGSGSIPIEMDCVFMPCHGMSTRRVTGNSSTSVKPYTTWSLAKAAGMSRKRVWECAKAGEIAGTSKTQGGDFRFTPEGGDRWIRIIAQQRAAQTARREQRKIERFERALRSNRSGILTIESIVMRFFQWRRENGATVLQKPEDVRQKFLREIEPIEDYIHDIRKSLNQPKILGEDPVATGIRHRHEASLAGVGD